MEITRGSGMDFQFHLYYGGRHSHQLANPSLNQAPFILDGIQRNETTGVTEVVFRLPNVKLKGRSMEIRKIYRFMKGENYFRQITVLRNMDAKEFRLTCPNSEKLCDLFYKPFGDLGPAPTAESSSQEQAHYGRFFYYGDELVTRTNKPADGKKGGGCSLLPFGCSNPDSDGVYTTRYNSIPDGLQLMGSHSRYFIAYTDFMTDKSPPLDKPDGLVYKNTTDLDGRESQTAAFHRFRLSAHKPGELDFGDVDRLQKDGKWLPAAQSNQLRIQETQYAHSDALIVNNKVFVGIRTSESHDFANPSLMAAEFGTDEPNPKAHNAIYSNRFYAFFSPIQSIIVTIMHWLYGIIGNYGWSIIIIAVTFKLATFPLNQIQAKSMKKMQAIKPQLEKINEQYADNPQEKQKKQMELYRKEGINPAKGCLPIVVQMPIFFALYSAFSSSIELWGSPFLLWIQDLSQPDTLAVLPIFGGFHLNILPLFMVVTQILQQHFTQMTVDPQQKMMMMFMPLMMLFFFWQFPSGVTLYWIVQNILAIVWQFAVNRNTEAEPKAA